MGSGVSVERERWSRARGVRLRSRIMTGMSKSHEARQIIVEKGHTN